MTRFTLAALVVTSLMSWAVTPAAAQNLSQQERYFIFRNYYLGQQRQQQLVQEQRELQAQIDRARRTEALLRQNESSDPIGDYVRGVGRGGYQPFYQREREFAGRPAATIGAGGGNASTYFSPVQGLTTQRRSPRYGTAR